MIRWKTSRAAEMKLLRTIRLDPSDAFVFTRAAEPGEWAVPGTFLFWERPVETLIGKERAAFRSGILGISSFGWSTLATIVEATEEERALAVEALAQKLLTDCGAPDLEAARAAAEAEIATSAELAEPAVGTLVAIHRSVEAARSSSVFAPCCRARMTGMAVCSNSWKSRTRLKSRSISSAS